MPMRSQEKLDKIARLNSNPSHAKAQLQQRRLCIAVSDRTVIQEVRLSCTTSPEPSRAGGSPVDGLLRVEWCRARVPSRVNSVRRRL
jgi:hypothetical protein